MAIPCVSPERERFPTSHVPGVQQSNSQNFIKPTMDMNTLLQNIKFIQLILLFSIGTQK
jgi:hypothetical protein